MQVLPFKKQINNGEPKKWPKVKPQTRVYGATRFKTVIKSKQTTEEYLRDQPQTWPRATRLAFCGIMPKVMRTKQKEKGLMRG